MLSVTIISPNDLGLGLALKMAKEGHLVKFVTEGGVVGRGYKNPKAYSSSQTLEEASDLFIFTSPIGSGLADRLRRLGRVVVGENKLLMNLQDPEFVNKAVN
jgi:hypothetical protein